MIVTSPRTSAEFERYYALRYDILRKPWNQPPGSEKDELESDSMHAMLMNDQGELTGVCRMQFNSAEEAQLRYMAISGNMQGKGTGRLLLEYFEQIAREHKIRRIVLQAREKAINFYLRNGYSVVEKSYLMWGEIQHYRMEKVL